MGVAPPPEPRGPRLRLLGLQLPMRALALHPAQVIVLAFSAVVALGTVLLMLPISKQGPGGTDFFNAFFHAVSAVCVTGLSSVDTGTHWTTFGEAVLLVLIQVGGFGIMTFASILGLVVARRLGLRGRLQTAAESQTLNQGDLRRVLWGLARISFIVEVSIAVILALRWWLGYDEPLGHAIWLGVFHSVGSFNNAGLALFSNSLIDYATDPFICLPVAIGVILGGLGFPVLMELRREFGDKLHWSLNTKIVVVVTAALLVVSTILITALEWGNAATLGAHDPPARVLGGFFQAVMPRSGGFNTVDIGLMHPETWFAIDVLMFIGGGPAGTGGGIKVTTFAVLVFLVYTEIRGEGAVNIFGRRLPRSVHRQAITVAALAVTTIILATFLLMILEPLNLDHALFEVTSAFTTTGLSTGATADLSPASQMLLVFLMFAGRIGPITLASAIALKRANRLYEYPKERPIIG
ncbi:MAG: potassium transporter TrkG [Solirubrobacteraceae bacterium]|nr:potassium transporter TrkG [Solirubrobacteraceae bacterium]